MMTPIHYAPRVTRFNGPKSLNKLSAIMDSNMAYAIDDWVGQKLLGIGQISGIEVNPIYGGDTICFKILTKDSTYWFPTTEKDNHRIRPVASKDIINKIVKTPEEKPPNLILTEVIGRKELANFIISATCYGPASSLVATEP